MKKFKFKRFIASLLVFATVLGMFTFASGETVYADSNDRRQILIQLAGGADLNSVEGVASLQVEDLRCIAMFLSNFYTPFLTSLDTENEEDTKGTMVQILEKLGFKEDAAKLLVENIFKASLATAKPLYFDFNETLHPDGIGFGDLLLGDEDSEEVSPYMSASDYINNDYLGGSGSYGVLTLASFYMLIQQLSLNTYDNFLCEATGVDPEKFCADTERTFTNYAYRGIPLYWDNNGVMVKTASINRYTILFLSEYMKQGEFCANLGTKGYLGNSAINVEMTDEAYSDMSDGQRLATNIFFQKLYIDWVGNIIADFGTHRVIVIPACVNPDIVKLTDTSYNMQLLNLVSAWGQFMVSSLSESNFGNALRYVGAVPLVNNRGKSDWIDLRDTIKYFFGDSSTPAGEILESYGFRVNTSNSSSDGLGIIKIVSKHVSAITNIASSSSSSSNSSGGFFGALINLGNALKDFGTDVGNNIYNAASGLNAWFGSFFIGGDAYAIQEMMYGSNIFELASGQNIDELLENDAIMFIHPKVIGLITYIPITEYLVANQVITYKNFTQISGKAGLSDGAFDVVSIVSNHDKLWIGNDNSTFSNIYDDKAFNKLINLGTKDFKKLQNYFVTYAYASMPNQDADTEIKLNWKFDFNSLPQDFDNAIDWSFYETAAVQEELMSIVYYLLHPTKGVAVFVKWVKEKIGGLLIGIHEDIVGNTESNSTLGNTKYLGTTGYVTSPTLSEISWASALLNSYNNIVIYLIILMCVILMFYMVTGQMSILRAIVGVVLFSVLAFLPPTLINLVTNTVNDVSTRIYDDKFDYWAYSQHTSYLRQLGQLEDASTVNEFYNIMLNLNNDMDSEGASFGGVRIKWMTPKRFNDLKEASDTLHSDLVDNGGYSNYFAGILVNGLATTYSTESYTHAVDATYLYRDFTDIYYHSAMTYNLYSTFAQGRDFDGGSETVVDTSTIDEAYHVMLLYYGSIEYDDSGNAIDMKPVEPFRSVLVIDTEDEFTDDEKLSIKTCVLETEPLRNVSSADLWLAKIVEEPTDGIYTTKELKGSIGFNSYVGYEVKGIKGEDIISTVRTALGLTEDIGLYSFQDIGVYGVSFTKTVSNSVRKTTYSVTDIPSSMKTLSDVISDRGLVGHHWSNFVSAADMYASTLGYITYPSGKNLHSYINENCYVNSIDKETSSLYAIRRGFINDTVNLDTYLTQTGNADPYYYIRSGNLATSYLLGYCHTIKSVHEKYVNLKLAVSDTEKLNFEGSTYNPVIEINRTVDGKLGTGTSIFGVRPETWDYNIKAFIQDKRSPIRAEDGYGSGLWKDLSSLYYSLYSESPYYYFDYCFRDYVTKNSNYWFNTSKLDSSVKNVYKCWLNNNQSYFFNYDEDAGDGYGELKDFMKMHDFFYYIIPSLYDGVNLARLFDDTFGLYVSPDVNLQIGSDGRIRIDGEEYTTINDIDLSKYDDEILYKVWHDLNVWLILDTYTPWLDAMMDCSYAKAETIIVMGEKFRVENPLDPTSYFEDDGSGHITAGRPMVFSRSEMAYYGLTEADLTGVESKIIEVQDNVYKNALELMNYYTLPDETLIFAYSMMCTFEFNKAFSQSSLTGDSYILYPQGYEAKAFTYDAYLRLVTSEASGEPLQTGKAENKSIYRRVLSNTSILYGVFLIINDVLAVYIIPYVRVAILFLLFMCSITLIVAGSVKLELNLFTVLWKSICAPLISYLVISLGFSFIVSLFMSNGASGVVETSSTIQVGDPTAVLIIMIVLHVAVTILYWKICKKCFADLKLYATSVFSSIGATVAGGFSTLAKVAVAGKAMSALDKINGSGAGGVSGTAKQRGKDNTSGVGSTAVAAGAGAGLGMASATSGGGDSSEGSGGSSGGSSSGGDTVNKYDKKAAKQDVSSAGYDIKSGKAAEKYEKTANKAENKIADAKEKKSKAEAKAKKNLEKCNKVMDKADATNNEKKFYKAVEKEQKIKDGLAKKQAKFDGKVTSTADKANSRLARLDRQKKHDDKMSKIKTKQADASRKMADAKRKQVAVKQNAKAQKAANKGGSKVKGSGVVSAIGSGAAKIGSGAAKIGSGAAKVGAGTVKVGAKVTKYGAKTGVAIAKTGVRTASNAAVAGAQAASKTINSTVNPDVSAQRQALNSRLNNSKK